jgi:hypothetical protein
MNTLTLEPPSVCIQDIKVTSSALTFELSDGRSIFLLAQEVAPEANRDN